MASLDRAQLGVLQGICRRFVDAVTADDHRAESVELTAAYEMFGIKGVLVLFRSLADAFCQWSGISAGLAEAGEAAFAGIEVHGPDGEPVSIEALIADGGDGAVAQVAATRFVVAHANGDMDMMLAVFQALDPDQRIKLGAALARMVHGAYQQQEWVPPEIGG